METIADLQHWDFQQRKHALTAAQRLAHADEDIRSGFLTRGLFRYSRHPNYFAEQAMWVVVYLYSCDAGHSSSALSQKLAQRLPRYQALLEHGFNWAGVGCVQLVLLFQGSMGFGESISAAKYPAYRDYQRSTPQCIPWPWAWSTRGSKQVKKQI
jgi:steroid 5-alpha reductase family enzyme